MYLIVWAAISGTCIGAGLALTLNGIWDWWNNRHDR